MSDSEIGFTILTLMWFFVMCAPDSWKFWRAAKQAEPPRPPAPCGDDEEHHDWEKEGFTCPYCAAIEEVKRLNLEQDRLAEKIAARVAERLGR